MECHSQEQRERAKQQDFSPLISPGQKPPTAPFPLSALRAMYATTASEIQKKNKLSWKKKIEKLRKLRDLEAKQLKNQSQRGCQAPYPLLCFLHHQKRSSSKSTVKLQRSIQISSRHSTGLTIVFWKLSFPLIVLGCTFAHESSFCMSPWVHC